MKSMNIGKRFLIFSVLLILLYSATACSKKGNESGIYPQKGTDTNVIVSANKKVDIALALFTSPEKVKVAAKDPVILDSLIRYVNSTPKGAKIHINIFEFDYLPLINAVKDACQRGVIVNAMLDNSADASIQKNKEAIKILQPVLQSPSKLVIVHSDVNAGSINHNKHVLFSEVNLSGGVAKNLVFSTSHNFTNSDMKKGQDAVVLTNEGLYNAFLYNWNAMAARATSGMSSLEYKAVNLGSMEVFFFPRRVAGKWDKQDNIIEVLDKLSPSDYAKDTFLVGMNGWTTNRNNIVDKLLELRKRGATVEVITKSDNSSELLSSLNVLRDFGGYLKILPYPQQNIHSKFMLIKGVWEGKRQTLILCGSHNYSSSALKTNNEVLIMLKNSSLFENYEDFFNKMKKI